MRNADVFLDKEPRKRTIVLERENTPLRAYVIVSASGVRKTVYLTKWEGTNWQVGDVILKAGKPSVEAAKEFVAHLRKKGWYVILKREDKR